MRKTIVIFISMVMVIGFFGCEKKPSEPGYLGEELSTAVEYGDLAEVKSLLDQGADVNLKDNSGYTALMMAVKMGHPDIAEMLKNAGA